MCSGDEPDMWKFAVICPILKKGDCCDVANYRSISLTCITRKVMETVVKCDLITYQVSNNLINKHQHGFIAKHSTSSQLLERLNHWSASIDKKNHVDVCYINFKSAFGSVSHEKLLHKLSVYGILGNLLSLFLAFLLNLQQVVDINGAKSDPVAVLSSVPEGSVIGPILFLIYINDLCDCIKYSDCKLFADDLKLYYSIATNAVPADNGLQSDL